MQYESFLDVSVTETIPVIFKTFINRKIKLLSGVFDRPGFERVDDAAIFELVAISDFESLVVMGGWTPAGSTTMMGYPIDELFRRGFDLDFRRKLFSHSLGLADAVRIGPEAIGVQ